MIVEITEELESGLTEAKRQVIEYINQHEDQFLKLTITELAEKSFTSPPTVSRAVRKCGYNGLSELRYKLSAMIEDMVEGEIVNEIFQKSVTECMKTIEILKAETILKVVRFIKTAQKIYIIARGSTAWIAKDVELQLQLLGYNAYMLSDSEVMKKSDKLFRHGDLIIIFSIKNSTPELLLTAQNAKKVGANVVTCCCLPKTDLEDYSDLSVLGYNQRNKTIEDFDIVSRLPLQIIARTLIDYLNL